jgi:hypothetical protein
MVRVENSAALSLLYQLLQFPFPIEEWQPSQVFVIDPEQVERIENWFVFARNQMIELAYAVRIQTDNFIVKDCVVHWQFSKSNTQKEKVEVILIARHQFAFVIFYISDCAKAVVFQFENVVWIIKPLCNALEAHGLDAGEHGLL